MSELTLRFASDATLLFAIVLLIGFFYVIYSFWDVLLYLALFVLAIGVLRRIFVGVRGIRLDRNVDKKLFDVSRRVADEIGVNPVNSIVLTLDSAVGVSGIVDRKLLIGVATLHAISCDDLYSILFHEFAHIKGADNIVGNMLVGLSYALKDLASLSRYSTYIFSIFGLLIFIPVLLFYYIFLIITLAYSRQREYLADSIAASFVGGKRFADALKKYTEASEDFTYKINQAIGYYAYKGMMPDNLYDAYRTLNIKFSEDTQAKINQQVKKLHEVTSPFSTHPALDGRLKQVEGIKSSVGSIGNQKASSLIKDMEDKEKRLTNIVYKKEKGLI